MAALQPHQAPSGCTAPAPGAGSVRAPKSRVQASLLRGPKVIETCRHGMEWMDRTI